MIKFKNDDSDIHKQIAYSAVKALSRFSSSSQIHDKYDSLLADAIENDIHNLVRMGQAPADTEKLRKKLRNRKKISKRTLQRKLKQLTDEGLIVCRYRRYSISNMKNPEVKIWPKDFGDGILYSAMKLIYPQYSTLEYNIRNLVETFGVYLLYCFVEAAMPYSGTANVTAIETHASSLSAERRNKLAIHWIENMLEPKDLFFYFVTLMKTQLRDEDVQIMRKKIFRIKNGKRGFKGTIEEYLNHLAKLMPGEVRFPLEYENKNDASQEKNILECDPHVLEKVKEILRRRYRQTYFQMEDAYNIFQIRNKQGDRLSGPELRFNSEDGLDLPIE